MKSRLIISFITGLFSLGIINVAIGQEYNISIAKPKVKVVDNKYQLRSLVESVLKEAVSNSSDYVRLINRNDIEEIEVRRKKVAKRIEGIDLAAATMIGANFILESKVSNIVVTEDVETVNKKVKDALVEHTVLAKNFGFDLDLSLVSVEDGSVASQIRVSPKGFAFDKNEYIYLIDKEKLEHQAVLDCRDCLASIVRYMLLQAVPVHSEVLDIHKSKKEEAKEIIIKAGLKSPLRTGVNFDILKVYEQEIGGQTVQRQEKIGEAKFEEILMHTSRCKVKKGSKEVYKAMMANEKLVLVTKDLKEKTTCSYYIQSPQRKSKKEAYKLALKADSLTEKKTEEKNNEKEGKEKLIIICF